MGEFVFNLVMLVVVAFLLLGLLALVDAAIWVGGRLVRFLGRGRSIDVLDRLPDGLTGPPGVRGRRL